MNINKLFSDKEYLNKELNYYKSKKLIKNIEPNKELAKAHLIKARHNLEFYKLNKQHNTFSDWLIVTLYYSLYHCTLALITNKNKTSKNHYATILLLIKEYNITKEEVNLIDELSITKEDAQLYTSLKEDRHNASYATNLNFTKEKIKHYEEKIIEFINKTQEILNNTK